MDCKQCDILLPSYAAGDLGYEEESEVRKHLEACECCRESFEVMSSLVDVVTDEPEIVPTEAETAALMAALADVKLPEPAVQRAREKRSNEFFGFVLASIAAFIAVAALLTRKTFNIADILSASPSSIMTVAVPLFVIVFITSFIPIVVTAYRRPLNGMTFRR